MAESIVGSYFEDNSGPLIGLSPTIRIWEVSGAGQSLVVGSPCGSGSSSDGIMIEVEDCGSPSTKDGYNIFAFSDGIGFDITKKYLVRIDAGDQVDSSVRYQTGTIEPVLDSEIIADAVWDEAKADHLTVGSTGEALSQTKADTTNIIDKLYLDADSVLQVVQLVLKMEAGRTKIDTVNSTLTVYDEDCTTVLRTFQLLDSGGNPNITSVIERKPIVKGAGDTTTITDVC